MVDFLRDADEEVEVIGLDLAKSCSSPVDTFHSVNLLDGAAVREIAREMRPERVIHLAGILPGGREELMWSVNVGGTVNLLQALAAESADVRVVNVGSAAEYLAVADGNVSETSRSGGASCYGQSKWAQTTVAQSFPRDCGLGIMTARPFNLLGSGLSTTLVAGAVCDQIREGKDTLELGNLSPERDFIDIRDAVAAYWRIAESGVPGEIYNVSRGQAVSVQELVDQFIAAADRPLTVKGEVSVEAGVSRVCGLNDKLRKLGWSPRFSLEDSVRDMLSS